MKLKLLVAMFVVSTVLVGIPIGAKKDYRRSDNPLLYRSTDEEHTAVVAPEPSGSFQERDMEQDLEIVVYDLKTRKIKKVTKLGKGIELRLPENRPSEYVPESVIFPDDRERVANPTEYPWRTICKLIITYPDDSQYIGSGFIVDSFHVITAGHCAFSGELPMSIEVIPALDGGYAPFYHAWATELHITSLWRDYAYAEEDFAILVLDRNVGTYTNWMGLAYDVPTNPVYSGTLTTAGYPGDLDDGWNMYYDSDLGDGADDFFHYYWMDTAGGQSGSPVWFDTTSVLSVHTHGGGDVSPNFGTRFSLYWFNLINYAFETDISPTDYANLIDDGQVWSDFTPTAVVSGVSNFDVWSDVRNVGTTDSGIFDVSYYALGDTGNYLIGTISVSSITPFTWATSDWSGTFPSIPAGDYYVGWIIDSNDDVNEARDDGEDDNFAYKDSYQLTVVEPVVSISVDPTIIGFGSVTQGESSESKDITITSASNVDVHITVSVTAETILGCYDDHLKLEFEDETYAVADFEMNILVNEPPEVVGVILSVPKTTAIGAHGATLVFWAEESQ